MYKAWLYLSPLEVRLLSILFHGFLSAHIVAAHY